MSSENDSTQIRLDPEAERRYNKLRKYGFPDAAVRRFLKAEKKPVLKGGSNFQRKVAGNLNEEELDALIQEFKYAGRKTIHYFVFTNIAQIEFERIVERVEDRFPERVDVEDVPNEPFFAESDVSGSCLYLTFGFYDITTGEDPVTGKREGDLTTRRSIVTIHSDMDLVEIRMSNPRMAERIRDEIGRSLGQYKQSNIYSPEFDGEFQREFSKVVEKYYNLKVRVDEEDGSTIDTISFTSKEDEEGVRKDARKDERVLKELDERGGEITMGYVELKDGFKFNINRQQSKLAFKRYESESNIEEVTTLINDVLRKTGGYFQQSLAGLENVPE